MTALKRSRIDADIVIVGGGHNALVCAGYLRRAGLSVIVLEARDRVGGACRTEAFHPGYRNSVYAYLLSLLHPRIIRELELEWHGLTILDRPAGSFCPQPDGRTLLVSRDPVRARTEIARFSAKDAARYDAFDAEIVTVARVFRKIALETPPNLGGGLADLITTLRTGGRVAGLDRHHQKVLFDLMTMSIGDYLDRWFDSDPIKGNFGFEGIIGNMVSPYSAGSAYVLLHHVFGEINGKIGAWGHARGGMGAVADALRRSAEIAGVTVRTDARVTEVLVDKGRAVGAVLADGTVVRGQAVVAGINPKLLYLRLIDPGALPPDFVRQMQGYRCRSGTFRMNVALSGLPHFRGLTGRQADREALNGTINIAPSLRYLEDAYDDAKHGGWAKRPVISMCIPTTLDDTLAPAGHHVASLFCQHFHPELADGQDWDAVKDGVADRVLDTVETYAPGFKDLVVGRQVKSPKDLERDLGLVGGDIFHGALHLDQIYSLRPAAGFAHYRGPLPGLYHCGSGAHPGGGVSGLPGLNASREIVKDIRHRRRAA